MKIAALFGSVALATECPAGQQTGITADGGVDESNDHTCYPSPDAAYVIHCNDPHNLQVEMKVAISKDFIADQPCISTGDCFKGDSLKNRWTYVFTPSQMASSRNGDNLVLTANVSTKPAAEGRKIYKKPEISVDFECSYPLGDQTVEENYTVTGEKLITTRRHHGSLNFIIDPVQEVLIGERASFNIVPASPGLVFFRPKYCRMKKGIMQHELLGAGGKDYCFDPATEFKMDTFGTSSAQRGSYTAFKWNTPSAIHNSEVQTIQCTIEFDLNEMDMTGTGEACDFPENNEEEPDFESRLIENNAFVDMAIWDF